MYNINANLFRASETQSWLLSSTNSENYSLATKLEWTFYYLIKTEFLYYNLSLLNFTFLHHFHPAKNIDSFKCFCTFFKQVEIMRKPRGWKNEYFKALAFKSTKKRLDKIPKFFFVWKTKDFAKTAFFQLRRKAFVFWADKYKKTYVLKKVRRIAHFFFVRSSVQSIIQNRQLQSLRQVFRSGGKSTKVLPKKSYRILVRCLTRLASLEDRWYHTMKPSIPELHRSSLHTIKTLQKKVFETRLARQFTRPVEMHFINVFNKLYTPINFNKIERDWQLKRYKHNRPRVFKDMIFAFSLISHKPVISWAVDLIANAFERNQKKQKRYIYFLKNLLVVLSKYGCGFPAYRLEFNGKLEGSRRTRLRVIKSGPMPLLTVDSVILYARSTALTKFGAQGIKVWLRY